MINASINNGMHSSGPLLQQLAKQIVLGTMMCSCKQTMNFFIYFFDLADTGLTFWLQFGFRLSKTAHTQFLCVPYRCKGGSLAYQIAISYISSFSLFFFVFIWKSFLENLLKVILSSHWQLHHFSSSLKKFSFIMVLA